MYIHLGQKTIVKDSDIIGIFDLDNTTSNNNTTNNYLVKAENNGDYVSTGSEYEIPNSFTVCENNGYRTVYVSPSSTVTIFKRTKTVFYG